MTQKSELDKFILRILKTEPPLKGDNAQNMITWFNSIRRELACGDIQLLPELSTRLMWIWLSQVKGLTVSNLEQLK